MFASAARADIFQWEYINPADPSQGKRQSTTLAPGGAGVDAAPGANLSGRNLMMAYLIGADLTNAYAQSNLNTAPSNLTNADLRQANLSDAEFGGATLTGAEFTDAEIQRANFGRVPFGFYGTSGTGITLAQLYSTATYQTHDLSGIRLQGNILPGGNFAGQNLQGADFLGANLGDANFREADLADANFGEYECADLFGCGYRGYDTTLTDADFTGAVLSGASFRGTYLAGVNFNGARIQGATFDQVETPCVEGGICGFAGGIMLAQLYSTASYQTGDLSGIKFGGNNLVGGNFAKQNLTGTSFSFASLAGADFTDAEIREASFAEATRCFSACYQVGVLTLAQLYSTASYQSHDLVGISFHRNDLSGADFTDQNLTNASFYVATLTDADFTDARVEGANFAATSGRGFTAAQLYSTASYQARNLTGIALGSNDLSGWNFAGQNLTNANIWSANLAGADFTDADMRGANFTFANLTSANFTDGDIRGASFGRVGCARLGGCLPHGTAGTGIALVQLYSTASYQARDLSNIDLSANDFGGANFTGQNLTNTSFRGATLTDADFTDAEIRGASFDKLTANCPFDICPVIRGTGITLAQLYSTASYRAKDLSGIGFFANDLSNGDFVGQNLTNAYLGGALTGADFTAADFRGAQFFYIDFSDAIFSDAVTTNLIRPDGLINGLDLDHGRLLVVRDYDGNPYGCGINGCPIPPIPITVDQHLAMGAGGTLRMVFEADAWDSTISFAPGVPVALGGTLELTFASGVDLATQVGRTFDVFDWTGVAPTGLFALSSPHIWDLSNLYSTGEITLAAIPEPTTVVLLIMAAGICVNRHRTIAFVS